jgi:hypothetical protein
LEGLLFGITGGVYLSEGAVLVRPDKAAALLSTLGVPPETVDGTKKGSDRPPVSGGAKSGRSATPAPQAVFRRFHGTISIDVPDPIGHFAQIVQNVVEHFSAQYGTEVAISVDVEARRSDGFDPKTVRTVRENAATMKFGTAEFEKE